MIKSEKVEYKSTVVKCSYYDKNLNTLVLEFVNGSRYIYYDVKEGDYEAFRLADSQGAALQVITNHPDIKYRKVESDLQLIAGFTSFSESYKNINNNFLSLLNRIEKLEDEQSIRTTI